MKTLWELLWDYDPNALIVLDQEMRIQLTNPAFYRMFRVECSDALGKDVRSIITDVEDFEKAWSLGEGISSVEKRYPEYDLFVKEIIFPIPNENLIACIFVDLTQEWKQREELTKLKRETIQHVNQVVDKQMSVAQQIAGLLGETTAETKVSLLKVMQMLEQEIA